MGNYRSSHQRQLVLKAMPHRVRELHYAVTVNDLETVRSLVAQGVNINFPWYNPSNPTVKDGSTPLIIAVSLNYTEIVELLLHATAYINKCDRNGCTAVYKAAFHGRPSLIEVLTRAGADVNLADFKGRTPLSICVNNGIVHSCKSAVQKLLKGGAIVDKHDRFGQAPIHLAAHWKLREFLQLLITAHSNVDLVDIKGRTPLYVCVCSLSTKLYVEDIRHQLPCILTLFHAGADMLNLTDWLLYKGSGLTEDLFQTNGAAGSAIVQLYGADFWAWYKGEVSQPPSLRNQCRKVIQKRACSRGPLVDIARKLPLPSYLQTYVARKMFFREEVHADIIATIQERSKLQSNNYCRS